jgi:hypothetical protein
MSQQEKEKKRAERLEAERNRKKQIRKEARETAARQGKKWDDLSKEERKQFRRASRRGIVMDAGP